MSKQQNSKPDKSSQPAASSSGGGKVIGTKPIRKISGPTCNPAHVGPKGAPYYAK